MLYHSSICPKHIQNIVILFVLWVKLRQKTANLLYPKNRKRKAKGTGRDGTGRKGSEAARLHSMLCVCACCHPVYFGRQSTSPDTIRECLSRCHKREGQHLFFRNVGFCPSPSLCGACLHLSSRKGSDGPFPSSAVFSNGVYPRHRHSPP